MIVVDTSALMAILLVEADGQVFADAIYRSDEAHIAAPTALEFLMVAGSARAVGVRPNAAAIAQDILSGLLSIMPFEIDHVRLAAKAFAAYGKGRGHPAQLNFGDCMSYALAKALDAPLLYKGDDFVHTDIRPAL